MTLNDLLSRLIGVKQRGARYSAICPAHADKSPSLSVSDGDTGVLLKCWAGCTLEEICSALGIRMADLFFDAGVPHNQRTAPIPPRLDRRALAFEFELKALDLRLRAERIITEGNNINIGILTDEELDRAIGCVAKAHADTERAELFEGVADGLRFKEFHERDNYEPQRVA